jgi:hypothetical protein
MYHFGGSGARLNSDAVPVPTVPTTHVMFILDIFKLGLVSFKKMNAFNR